MPLDLFAYGRKSKRLGWGKVKDKWRQRNLDHKAVIFLGKTM